jgi:hypothetical protein
METPGVETTMREVVQITLAELAFVGAGVALLWLAMLTLVVCHLKGKLQDVKAKAVDLPELTKQTDELTGSVDHSELMADCAIRGNGQPSPNVTESRTFGPMVQNDHD